MKQILFLAGTMTFLLAACSQSETEKTDLGTEVTFITRGEGEALENSNIITMSLWYGMDGKAFRDSKGETLPYQYFEDTLNMNGQFASVLELLSVGDSVKFTVPAGDLYTNTFQQPLPDSLTEESGIEWALRVEDQYTREAYQLIAEEKAAAAEKEILAEETVKFDEFLAQEGITTTKTESGLQYEIKKMGTGPTATVGQQVKVKYKGMFFEGRDVFDEGEYTFALGQRSVIAGWDEGFSYLPQGTEAVLYIPSTLGYGARGRGPIPPNASLVFEVEVLEVVQ